MTRSPSTVISPPWAMSLRACMISRAVNASRASPPTTKMTVVAVAPRMGMRPMRMPKGYTKGTMTMPAPMASDESDPLKGLVGV